VSQISTLYIAECLGTQQNDSIIMLRAMNAECCVFIVMLNVFKLNVIMPNVVMLSVAVPFSIFLFLPLVINFA
jgi:hypothetical protein